MDIRQEQQRESEERGGPEAWSYRSWIQRMGKEPRFLQKRNRAPIGEPTTFEAEEREL